MGKMNDAELTIFVLSLSLLLLLILYVFSNFVYRPRKDMLLMKWRILGVIPYACRKVPLEEIEDARECSLNTDFADGYLFGNAFHKRKVILILKRRKLRFLFIKKIIITPEKPGQLISELNELLKQKSEERKQKGKA